MNVEVDVLECEHFDGADDILLLDAPDTNDGFLFHVLNR